MKEPIAGRERTDRSRAHTKRDKASRSVKDGAEDWLGVINGLVQRTRCEGCRPSMRGMAAQLSAMHPAARREAALSLRSARGNRFLQRLAAQAKLKVGVANDRYEMEASRIADQVMKVPEHHAVSGTLQHIQRFSKQPSRQAEVAPASVDQALASPGRPLEPTLRQDMEQRFGYDFSKVQVHSGTAAELSAQDLNALAYTVGPDIVFGAYQFAPETLEGRLLIAHELAHVVQQSEFIRPYRDSNAWKFGTYDDKIGEGRLIEGSFDIKRDKKTKPWIELITIEFTSKMIDANGNNYWVGTASVKYYNNPAKFEDFSFAISGGSRELGRTDRGSFTVHRIETMGYNSGSFSAPYHPFEREGPKNRYSKDLRGNMNFAVFYNKGEALHAGPLDLSSHGCVHVDWNDYQHIKQINYHSVKGLTKVKVKYPSK